MTSVTHFPMKDKPADLREPDVEMPERLIPADMDEDLEQAILRVPEHCRGPLLNYLRYGLPPGGFLRALLSNNLSEACGRADEMNRYVLYDYVYVLYNYAPSQAWGSPMKVEAWINKGLKARRKVEGES